MVSRVKFKNVWMENVSNPVIFVTGRRWDGVEGKIQECVDGKCL